jgi:hypothetical protein
MTPVRLLTVKDDDLREAELEAISLAMDYLNGVPVVVPKVVMVVNTILALRRSAGITWETK